MGPAAGFLLIGAALLAVGVLGAKGAQLTSGAQQAVTTQVGSAPAGGAMYGQVPFSLVAQIGKSKGWSDAQIQDWWQHLIPSESDGTLTDTNPTTKAYGIAQGITGPGWYYQHGGNPNTVEGQLTGMANYIEGRYHDPSAAWAFHQVHNWY